jgi:Flp pilus assembly protein TadG
MAGSSDDAELVYGYTHPMNRARSFWRGADDGTTAVEAGVVISVLVLLMVGSMEFGRALWTYNTMTLAVQEGGRYAMVYNATSFPSGPPAASCPSAATVTLANCAVARASEYLSAYGTPSVGVSASVDGSTAPNMTISATYTFNFILSGLLPYGPINLTSQVTVPLI